MCIYIFVCIHINIYICIYIYMSLPHMTRFGASNDVCMNKSCHTHESVMSRLNESCRIVMSRLNDIYVPYEWVMSHVNESCHIWMSHVTFEWVMSHVNESCHMWMSHVTYKRVMSHLSESYRIWKRYVTYEKISHLMSHVTYDDMCPICRQINWVSRMNESNYTYKSYHVWRMSHVPRGWVI